jgi:hypothetical protein
MWARQRLKAGGSSGIRGRFWFVPTITRTNVIAMAMDCKFSLLVKKSAIYSEPCIPRSVRPVLHVSITSSNRREMRLGIESRSIARGTAESSNWLSSRSAPSGESVLVSNSDVYNGLWTAPLQMSRLHGENDQWSSVHCSLRPVAPPHPLLQLI